MKQQCASTRGNGQRCTNGAAEHLRHCEPCMRLRLRVITNACMVLVDSLVEPAKRPQAKASLTLLASLVVNVLDAPWTVPPEPPSQGTSTDIRWAEDSLRQTMEDEAEQ